MEMLKAAILTLVQNVHEQKIEQLVSRVKAAGDEDDPYKGWVTSERSRQLITELLAALKPIKMTNAELASLIEGIDFAYRRLSASESIELVWTGPDTRVVPVRHSSRVLREMIDSAQKELFITSYATYPLPEIEEALTQAVARQIKVYVLLESISRDASSSFQWGVDRYKKLLPNGSVYVWPLENRPGPTHAAMHAKCVVADSKSCFVTSANITESAMDSNLEVGILTYGGPVPQQLREQLYSLIVKRTIVEG